MAKHFKKYDELGACELCDHCIEHQYAKFSCGMYSAKFGETNFPEDCEEFVFANLNDEEDTDNDIDFNPNLPIECPECGNDAFWEGSCYECEQCGWCGK